MADPSGKRELDLTKLLRHGFGLLTIKIHDHRLAALEMTIRWTRIG
ncbi:MAG TPA: hypothetical protein VJU54_04290 [Nitrospiraceae bacterium]|nr:hypothetical protein [Nitrospiraceae bacterium]